MVDHLEFRGRPFEGDERLSEPRPKSTSGKAGESGPAGKAARGAPKDGSRRAGAPRKTQGDVGRVLRSVYDTTLNEDIPDDFLDLLGKLD